MFFLQKYLSMCTSLLRQVPLKRHESTELALVTGKLLSVPLATRDTVNKTIRTAIRNKRLQVAIAGQFPSGSIPVTIFSNP